MLNFAVAAHLFILIHLAVIIDKSSHSSYSLIFISDYFFIHSRLFTQVYIRLFSFLLSYGKTRATKNMQLVTQQPKRESENHL